MSGKNNTSTWISELARGNGGGDAGTTVRVSTTATAARRYGNGGGGYATTTATTTPATAGA